MNNYEGGCRVCGFPLKELCSHPQCLAAIKTGYCSTGCSAKAAKLLVDQIKRAVA